jgi:hypothetical protein
MEKRILINILEISICRILFFQKKKVFGRWVPTLPYYYGSGFNTDPQSVFFIAQYWSQQVQRASSTMTSIYCKYTTWTRISDADSTIEKGLLACLWRMLCGAHEDLVATPFRNL